LGVKLKFLKSGTFCFSTILAVQNGQQEQAWLGVQNNVSWCCGLLLVYYLYPSGAPEFTRGF
jgi:uncharacterized membrane protein YdcZ (DUF606 family)